MKKNGAAVALLGFIVIQNTRSPVVVCMSVCYLVVIARAEEDVVSSRVPLDEAHSAAVTLELLPRRCDVLQHTTSRDFPHFHLYTHTHTHTENTM